jgi:hypothetical protein
VDKRFAPPILAEFIEALPKLHSVLDDLDELDVGATDIPEHAETGTVDGEDPGGLVGEPLETFVMCVLCPYQAMQYAERMSHCRSKAGGEATAAGVILSEALRITEQLQDENLCLWIVPVIVREIASKPIGTSMRLQILVHGRLTGDGRRSFWAYPLFQQIARTALADDFEVAIPSRHIDDGQITVDNRFLANKLTLQ